MKELEAIKQKEKEDKLAAEKLSDEVKKQEDLKAAAEKQAETEAMYEELTTQRNIAASMEEARVAIKQRELKIKEEVKTLEEQEKNLKKAGVATKACCEIPGYSSNSEQFTLQQEKANILEAKKVQQAAILKIKETAVKKIETYLENFGDKYSKETWAAFNTKEGAFPMSAPPVSGQGWVDNTVSPLAPIKCPVGDKDKEPNQEDKLVLPGWSSADDDELSQLWTGVKEVLDLVPEITKARSIQETYKAQLATSKTSLSEVVEVATTNVHASPLSIK